MARPRLQAVQASCQSKRFDPVKDRDISLGGSPEFQLIAIRRQNKLVTCFSTIRDRLLVDDGWEQDQLIRGFHLVGSGLAEPDQIFLPRDSHESAIWLKRDLNLAMGGNHM